MINTQISDAITVFTTLFFYCVPQSCPPVTMTLKTSKLQDYNKKRHGCFLIHPCHIYHLSAVSHCKSYLSFLRISGHGGFFKILCEKSLTIIFCYICQFWTHQPCRLVHFGFFYHVSYKTAVAEVFFCPRFFEDRQQSVFYIAVKAQSFVFSDQSCYVEKLKGAVVLKGNMEGDPWSQTWVFLKKHFHFFRVPCKYNHHISGRLKSFIMSSYSSYE